jgi:diacylglycerol kinase (ATP)
MQSVQCQDTPTARAFCSTPPASLTKTSPVRTCIIFNPIARGARARRFRHHLDSVGEHCVLKQTTHAGGARALAAEAVGEGFETIVAAGGDGTLNEVLNGIGDAPDGFDRARLGVLPLGTVNVFAKELGMPGQWKKSMTILLAGKEKTIDLPQVEYAGAEKRERRYFAQLAGTGLDARAIALADFNLKKKIGPLAYVWAGVLAMFAPKSEIVVTINGQTLNAALVLVGNGRFYGGKYRLFPQADMRDGALDVCVFPKANWFTLIRSTGMFVLRLDLPRGVARRIRAETFTLSSPQRSPVEVDGENIGHLPATFSVQKQRLRIVVP